MANGNPPSVSVRIQRTGSGRLNVVAAIRASLDKEET